MIKYRLIFKLCEKMWWNVDVILFQDAWDMDDSYEIQTMHGLDKVIPKNGKSVFITFLNSGIHKSVGIVD